MQCFNTSVLRLESQVPSQSVISVYLGSEQFWNGLLPIYQKSLVLRPHHTDLYRWNFQNPCFGLENVWMQNPYDSRQQLKPINRYPLLPATLWSIVHFSSPGFCLGQSYYQTVTFSGDFSLSITSLKTVWTLLIWNWVPRKLFWT